MTKLMEQIIERLRAVPEDLQDDVARSVGLQLEDDERWAKTTEAYGDNVARLVQDVLSAHRRGEAELLDPEKL